MDIQVIGIALPGESPDHLKAIARVVPIGRGIPIVHADAYGAGGLLEILEVRAARGEREILVMGCSPDQVQAVLEWSVCEEEQLQDLEIFLVRRS